MKVPGIVDVPRRRPCREIDLPPRSRANTSGSPEWDHDPAGRVNPFWMMSIAGRPVVRMIAMLCSAESQLVELRLARELCA
jgi:hypothetical protein